MKIIERLKAMKKLEEGLESPWRHESRIGLKVVLFGSQVSFTNDGDFVELPEAREMLQYWVEQFGGKVKWDK